MSDTGHDDSEPKTEPSDPTTGTDDTDDTDCSRCDDNVVPVAISSAIFSADRSPACDSCTGTFLLVDVETSATSVIVGPARLKSLFPDRIFGRRLGAQEQTCLALDPRRSLAET